MNTNVLVSVIVPCFNNGKYLKELIDCFKKQTVDCWELNIVDDGSTDETPIEIINYITDYNNIHFYHRDREPKNGDTCRNIGYEMSVGKYVIFIDADDLVSDTFVQNRVEYMESNPDVDYASFPSKAFYDVNNLPTLDSDGYVYGVYRGQLDLISELLKGYSYPFGVWSNIYRKSSLLGAQIRWDENLFVYQDFYFLLCTILAGLKHSFGPAVEVDYYYRQILNDNHVCGHFSSQRKVDSTNYLFEKVILELKDKGLFNKYRNDFLDFILLHFERLINDGCSKENLNAYKSLCIKYYGKKRSFSFLQRLVIIRNYRIRRLLFVLCGGVLFRINRYKASLIRNVLLVRK